MHRSLGEQNRRFPRTGIQAQHPAPAPHARTHDTTDQWRDGFLVARAKVGGRDCSLSGSRNVAPSRACSFVHFEQGITMVLLRTCPSRLTKIRFWWLVVHLSKELQWFSSPQDAECLSHVIKIRVWWIMVEITKEFQCFFVRPPFKLYFRLRPATKSIKTASGAPRPKSAPRGSKSTTFA